MISGLAAILLATVVSIELLRASRLFAAFGALSAHGRRASRLLVRTGVSEWAKERALALASRRMFALSFAAAGRLLLVAAPFVAILLVDRLWPFGLDRAWTNWPARIALLAITSLYIVARRRLGQADRLFERVTLGCGPLQELSFDLERTLHRGVIVPRDTRPPVFVVGLARAGTSVLTRALHRSGEFSSLSYRDLPFPLAPNLWHRASRGWARSIAAVERGHGDGLLHDLDSPEAIEEIFWLAQEGRAFRRPDRLVPARARRSTIAAFRDYIGLVQARYGTWRYLSKNNSNILRLPALIEAFPDAMLLHPFRDPAEQAASLLKQHERACELAHGDAYRARFMTWLGHHEFGADHRPFHFPDALPPAGDVGGINYWLQAWIQAYRFLLDQPEEIGARQIFVDYDRLCADPARAAIRMQRALDLNGIPDFGDVRPPARHIERLCDPHLLRAAREVHQALALRAQRADRLGRIATPGAAAPVGRSVSA